MHTHSQYNIKAKSVGNLSMVFIIHILRVCMAITS